MKIAIIGGGIAGLSAARELVHHGYDITVFDKGRIPGGRCSTRIQDGFEFDHGAPFFAVNDGRFRSYIETAIGDGKAKQHDFRFADIKAETISTDARAEDRYVGVPGMNAIAGHLAAGIDVRSSIRVVGMKRAGLSWEISDDSGRELGGYEAIIVATPPAQAADILSGAPALRAKAKDVEMFPCWTVMAAFDSNIDLPWDVASVTDGKLDTIICNRIKPGRPRGETWVMHAKPDWTLENIELLPKDVVEVLLAEFVSVTDARLPGILFTNAHRWRFANPVRPMESTYLWDRELRVGVCGDWCNGSDIEAAFLSGLDLAGAVIRASVANDLPMEVDVNE
jgi:predicted NAD/FAD-dependent oxidoreductase